MKAQLRRIDTNSATAFHALQPEDPRRFGTWLNASIGPAGMQSADDFQVFVCNPAWLEGRQGLPLETKQRRFLVDGPFDAAAIKAQIEAFLDECVGESWPELVAQISKIGVWEFEGYKP